MKKRRLFGILLSLALVLGLMPGMSLTAFADGTPAYSGGTGTEADPYLISTVNDWTALAAAVNSGTDYSSKYFKQTADLDMSGAGTLAPVGTLTAPFAGNYEGDGFAISGATINVVVNSGAAVAGVFGVLVGEGHISNLRVTNVTATATTGDDGWDQAYVGGLVAFAENCTITDCSVSNSTITASGSNNFAGAFVGFAGAENSEKTTFSKCASENNTVNTMGYGGGFIGAIVNDTSSDDAISFTDCYSARNLADAGAHKYGTVGAFLGGSQGGNVTAQNCFVYDCNATATGTGSFKGVFAGDITYGTVKATNTYYYATQNLPVNAESAIAKTTDEMKSLASALGEAFTQGSDYPILLHPVNLEVSIEGWAYGGTANEPRVTRNSSDGEVTYQYKVNGVDDNTYSDTAPTGAGDYTVKATVAATTTHKAAEATADFTIAKVDAAVTTAPTAKTLTANGQAQALVTAGEASGGEMQYALGDNATDAPEENRYTTSIPTATDAGTYYVWYKACGDANHSDSEPDSVTVTIGETETVATPTFSPDAGTYTEAQSVTISCETTGATIYYTTDGSNPSSSSTAYSGAITVGETTTIKAIAVKEGMTDSSVASTTYTISEGPEPSEETKVEVDVDDLSDDSISDDLKNSDFNTVSKIEDALETALSITTEEEKERSKLVDVKLMISTDGGIHWDEATAQNFPAGGIDVVLPYPDGTNGDEYSFSVAHMIGTSANGKNAGEIEKPGTTNTSSGIRTHFNGLSPVMITWIKNSSSSKDDGKSEEKAHTHHYVWETVEATENSDGELRYKCDICGDIQTRVPITAYYVFNKNTSEKIRKAGQGAIVKIETSRWISFHKMVMQALADRPDVSLEVSFLDGEYKGNRVSFTIPAGADTLSLLDENGFSGFLYLAGKYGYTLEN